MLPDTLSTSEMAGSTESVMGPPVAVKGPKVSGAPGRLRVRPVDGTGLGMGASMARLPLETDPGVAPTASTLVTAVR